MQILYVGNGNYKHSGARYYDVGRKVANGLTRLGHNVYFLSDRDEARATNIFGSRSLGVKNCNKAFLEICRNFQPEAIFLHHADILTPGSLEEARRILPAVRIAQFNVDPIFRPHNIAMIKGKLAQVDATFCTTAGPALKRFSGQRSVVSYMPNPIDSSMEWPRCHAHSDQPHDVFWALRATKGSYPGDPRIDLPLMLEKSGKVAMAYYGMNGKPELFGADYYKEIAKAKMGLNIAVDRTWGDQPRASDEERYLYASDRLSHYMGSGLLTFTNRDNALEEMFAEGKELVFFASPEELLDKAVYYKNHDSERRAIAEAGWRKSHEQLNSTLVAHYMLEVTLGRTASQGYAWPTELY